MSANTVAPAAGTPAGTPSGPAGGSTGTRDATERAAVDGSPEGDHPSPADGSSVTPGAPDAAAVDALPAIASPAPDPHAAAIAAAADTASAARASIATADEDAAVAVTESDPNATAAATATAGRVAAAPARTAVPNTPAIRAAGAPILRGGALAGAVATRTSGATTPVVRPVAGAPAGRAAAGASPSVRATTGGLGSVTRAAAAPATPSTPAVRATTSAAGAPTVRTGTVSVGRSAAPPAVTPTSGTPVLKAAAVTAKATATATTSASASTRGASAAPPAVPADPADAVDVAVTAALPGLPQALSTRARTLAGAVRRRCADLARMESPSGDAPRLNALAEELGAGFAATGATVRREPGPAGDHLVMEWAGEREDLPHLLVVGHHDTVWPAGTLADWPVEESEGRLSGPGVLDMKAGLALLEGAFALLADLGQRPYCPVRLVVVADEEVGSPDGRRLFERQLAGAAAVLGLEPAHPDGRLKTARRGSSRVRLTVTGREAHAGNDAAEGVSAVDELVDQLVAVRGLTRQPGTELNTGRITGGTRANVIAGRAEAELGLRFASAEAQRRTLDTLAHLTALRPGARIRTEVLSSRPTWPERSGNPLLRHVRSLAAVLGQQLDGAPAGGAGDTNLAGARGLPTLDGLGAVGAGPHARHEHIRVDQLAPRIALLAGLLAVPLPRLRGRS